MFSTCKVIIPIQKEKCIVDQFPGKGSIFSKVLKLFKKDEFQNFQNTILLFS